MHGLFEQVALVLAVCVAVGGLAVALRLPLLVGLLVAGVLVGPDVLGLVVGGPEIELLAELGIALLLFVVGLKIDPALVRRLGGAVLAVGLVQVLVTVVIAAAIAMVGGLSLVPALYVGGAMAFSSTVIVVKLLTDRRELEELHGRIALGILIVQDIVVVGAMIALASLGPANEGPIVAQVLSILLRGVGLLAVVALLARTLLPRVIHLLARLPELLLLSSVAWAVTVAAMATVLGFSAEVGAFVAGVALASSDYRDAISGRLTTLRDFLLVFFFIELGVQLELGAGVQLGAIVALSLFVLVGKPLLIATITTLLGFSAAVGVRAGITLAQISEFSLILLTVGVSLGHLGPETVGLVTAVALLTITASTFVSGRAATLVGPLSRPLRRLERARPVDVDVPDEAARPSAIVIGVGRLGRTVLDELLEQGHDVLGVDFDPRTVRDEGHPVPVVYGDANDPELAHALPLEQARWVVSTVRDPSVHRVLLTGLRAHGYRGRTAVAVDEPDDADALRMAGAHVVIRPFHVAAAPFVQLLHHHEESDDRTTM